MKLKTLWATAALAVVATLGSDASADIIFQSGELENPANWINSVDGTTGRPGAGEVGIISFTGTLAVGNATLAEGGLNNAGNTIAGFDNSTINHTSGTLTGAWNYTNPGAVYNLQGGTISNTSGNFNANNGSIFNLSAGTLDLNGGDLIVNNSTGGINLSGSADIIADTQFDLRLNQPGAFFNIDSNWTGSFQAGSETSIADWIAELVTGATSLGTAAGGTNFIAVDGTQITAANFEDFFEITPLAGGGSGTSLSLIATAVPEPSSIALLGLGAIGFVTRRRRS